MVEGGEEFYNIINGLAQTDNFKRSIDRLPDTAIEQKGDEELVLRFFAVKNFIGGYHGNVQEWLDSYMEHVLFRKVDFDIASETKAFERIFHIIYGSLCETDLRWCFASFERIGGAAPYPVLLISD